MATLKAIKTKMGTVKNVKKITKTMEAVSTSKMKKAINAALQTREYATLGLELLHNLSKERVLDHDLLHLGKGDKTLVVLFASNKGLCGSFNIAVARGAWKYLNSHENIKNPNFVAVGKYAERFAKKTSSPLVASFTEVLDYPDPEKMLSVSRLVIDEFKKGEYKRVVLVYANFVSALKYEPVVRKVLPVQEKIVRNMLESTGEGFAMEGELKQSLYTFEPNEGEVLDFVLEKLVEVMHYQALLESLASEHSARRTAMKNATDNAGKVFDELLLEYNRARQASITQEISEISAGAEALK